MKSSLENRLTKIEKTVEKLLSPLVDAVIFVNKDRGESLEEKITEKERELKSKINRDKAIFLIVSGLDRI